MSTSKPIENKVAISIQNTAENKTLSVQETEALIRRTKTKLSLESVSQFLNFQTHNGQVWLTPDDVDILKIQLKRTAYVVTIKSQ